jgi:glycosyltransferase involved in cell wall biosynthesis
MRIAQVMAGAPRGGAEGFFERLTLALHRAGEEVLPVIRRDAARAARLREGGLRPVELGFGGPLDLLTGPRLRAVLGAFRPEVVVAWMNRAAGFTPRGTWTLVGRLGGYYDLKYYRRCDWLVGNTRDLAQWIAGQGWPAERTAFLPNFAADLAGAAPERPFPEGPHLLAMGRLHPNKGFDVLLRALALLPGARLALAGEGPERAVLEALAAELGVADCVRFLGWQQEVGGLLAGAEMLVCPSRHEPLGNVVLEAFAAGRPVVAAAVQGPAALVEQGVTGLLVPPEDPAALAAAIAALRADPARAAAMGEAAHAAFLRDHAEAQVVAEWRRFLAQVSPLRADAA